MPLNPDVLLAWPFPVIEAAYTEDDCIRYALSVGVGADALDERQLPYVVQGGVGVLATMATVLAPTGPWTGDPRTGVTRAKLVHGEQSVRLVRPLPRVARVTSEARVRAVADRGAERGAVIYIERSLRLADCGELLAVLRSASVCRADGGFGGNPQAPWAHRAVPDDRAPDEMAQYATPLNAALLYQLNGDRNPLHTSPAYARRAGFDRPILHGLCSFGIAGQLLQACLADHVPDAIGEISGRFSAPAYPGDTLQVEVWRGDGEAHFRVWAKDRQAKIIDNGYVRLGLAASDHEHSD